MSTDLGKTSTGLSPNVAALLCYVGLFVTGIIFLVLEKDNKFVRFHAMQSTITFAAVSALQITFSILVFLALLVPIVGLIGLILWIILMSKAYKGEQFKLPVIGDFAEKNI